MSNVIPISQPTITQREIGFVTDAVSSGWVSSLGPYIERFESKFAEFCGVKYALTVANGTVALHLALESLGIGESDEVIIPDFTFVATANAVTYTGANVVSVDIDEDTLCLDPQRLESAITSHTKAIIPVHIYGHPADMTEINRIAKKHNLLVIEDAAEAHGAEILGRKVGSFGTCGVFSFYGNKIITSGEGGMITTDNESLYIRAKYLRDHAMSKEKRYWHTAVGYNYRMTNLQAALGSAQLERIEEIIRKKEIIYKWYYDGLIGRHTVRLNHTAPWAKNVYWMICLELTGYDSVKRDDFMKKMKERNVDTRPYFYPVSDMPMYKRADTPITHKICQQGINLPSYFDITHAEVDYICESIVSILGG